MSRRRLSLGRVPTIRGELQWVQKAHDFWSLESRDPDRGILAEVEPRWHRGFTISTWVNNYPKRLLHSAPRLRTALRLAEHLAYREEAAYWAACEERAKKAREAARVEAEQLEAYQAAHPEITVFVPGEPICFFPGPEIKRQDP